MGDQPTAGHHRDAVGQQQGLGHVVGDHDGGKPQPLVQGAVVLAQRVAGQGVERAEGLVHQHDARLGGQGAGDTHPLPLPTGQGRGEPPPHLPRKGHQIQQLIDAGVHPRLVPAQQARGDGDVLRHRQMRKEADLLEDIADGPAQQVPRLARDQPPVDADLAAVGDDQPVDGLQKGRLARPRRPHQGDELAAGDLEIDGGQGALGAIGLLDAQERDTGLGHAQA